MVVVQQAPEIVGGEACGEILGAQVLAWPVTSQPFPFLKKESWVIFLRLLFLWNFFIPLSSPHSVCCLLITTVGLSPRTQFSSGPPRSYSNLSWRGRRCFRNLHYQENSWNWAHVLLFLFSKRHPPLHPTTAVVGVRSWLPGQGGWTSRQHSLCQSRAKDICWDGSHLRGASGSSWAPFSGNLHLKALVFKTKSQQNLGLSSLCLRGSEDEFSIWDPCKDRSCLTPCSKRIPSQATKEEDLE